MDTPGEPLEDLVKEIAQLRGELTAQRDALQALQRKANVTGIRLEGLARRLEMTRAEPADVPSATPPPVAPTEAPPPKPPPLSEEHDEAPPTPPPSAPAAREPVPPHDQDEVRTKGTLETKIGGYWFVRLGAISMLVGFVFFARHFSRLMTPPVRVGLTYLASLALCAIGVATRRALPQFSRPLLAAGMVLAFFTSFAGHFVPPMHCFSLATSTFLMLVVAAVVVGVAGVLRSQPLGGLALAMGFWVAIFATKLTDAFTPIMLVFLGIVGIVFLLAFRWAPLTALGVIGVYVCFVWWHAVGNRGGVGFGGQMTFLTAYFAAFLIGDVINRLLGRGRALLSPDTGVSLEQSGLLAGRLLNPVAYFAVGSLVFWQTKIYWQDIHLFYWPLGVLLAGVAVLGWVIDRKGTLEDDVLYVLSSGVISLGLASYFDAMALSNVLALEGLCLFLIRMATGRAVFTWLSRAIYVAAFAHFNASSLEHHALRPASITDWTAFGEGLPAVLFMLAPTFLLPIWTRRPDTDADPIEPPIAHLRTVLGSLLLFRLIYHTIEPDPALGIWTSLAVAAVLLAWLWRAVFALPTLAGTFLLWAHFYLGVEWRQIDIGAAWWLFPSAIVVTLLAVVAEVLVERGVWRQLPDSPPALRQSDHGRLALAWMLVAACVLDVLLLVHLRAEPVHQYAIATACGLALLAPLLLARVALPAVAGMVLIVVHSAIQLYRCEQAKLVDRADFIALTLLGVGLIVTFDRLLSRWARTHFLPAIQTVKVGSHVISVLIALTLLGLVHFGHRVPAEYETVGFTAVAVLMFAAGVVMRASPYRRLGLIVFLLALARVYLIDLAGLETYYRMVAFLVLGGVLIGISFLYTRFREHFQRWV